MKILIFYQYFTTPKGSWGTRIYEFTKEWVKEGHEVTVVSSIYSKSDLKAEKFIEDQVFDGVKVKVVNIKIDNKQPILKRIFTFIAYSVISSWYAVTLKSDIVIASSGPITVGIPGLLSNFFSKKKLVFEARDLWPEVPIEVGVINNKVIKEVAYAFEKLIYKRADLVVGLSPGMRDYIKNNFNHPNVISVTNSANLKLFSSEKKIPENDFLKGEDFYAIYTGNIGFINNSFWLVDAARILNERNRKDIKIVLVGDGQQKDEILDIIKQEELTCLIHFDLMPKENLIPYIQNANASLVPLKTTPVLDTSSPNKFFESLAAGVPVIQTTNGWIRDYLEINEAGFTVDGSKPEDLADLLIHLKDSGTSNEMKENAKQSAKRDFDQVKLAKRYLSAILSIK
ncbi:glycosyltransferase family 4 protein [uncultured Tenacibaculum sp.]|uniref:glycosyltransferase family 4 protein n=1 Tax=uncultured Tenacibaculum sp. TaxID=174713 RepID=UPI00261B65D4|nr:glycosyltransferase family 4 protein [uncultured Tenacibaculum sp.]